MKYERFIELLALQYALKNRRTSRIDLVADSGENMANVLITFPDGAKGLFEHPLRDLWGEVTPEPDLVERHSKRMVSRREFEERLLDYAAERLKLVEKKSKKKAPSLVSKTPLVANS